MATSIQRANALLGEADREAAIVVLKIQPVPHSCCCFHCWPHTWQLINDFVAPQGPIKDEGDLLLESEGGPLVLECHESGPEVVLYLAATTAVVTLVKSVVDLVTAIVASRSRESHGGRLKLTSSRTVNGVTGREEAIELELPLSPDTVKLIEQHVRRELEEHI